MPSTNEHIAARDDVDLQRRLIATAEQMGIPNAASVVASNLGAIVSKTITVNGEQTCVAQVHAYATAVREAYLADERALPPGLNTATVTDIILAQAVTAVVDPAPASGV